MLSTPNRCRGVSLVEALVALAVMAFGMLALVGVQSTMRLNSDLAKQRSEATRIAVEELERLRSFQSVAAVQEQPGTSYDEIAYRELPAYQPPDGIGNTTYSVERTVNDLAGTQQKVITVQVSWSDRTGAPQTVTVDGVISATDPRLAGLLTVPPQPSPANQRDGRHPSIPPEAVDVGNQRSAFKPFDNGAVVWVFNNQTGVITSKCTAVTAGQSMITSSDLSNCEVVSGRRVAGFVQFDLGSNPSSENPAGPVLPLASTNPLDFPNTAMARVNQSRAADCVASPSSIASEAAAAIPSPIGFAVAYECVVFPNDASGWGGILVVNVAPTYGDGATTPTERKVCRYTPSSTDFAANPDHPKTYCVDKSGATNEAPCTGKKVTGNLINQNFLVIRGDLQCPADDGSTSLINGNTRPHQP